MAEIYSNDSTLMSVGERSTCSLSLCSRTVDFFFFPDNDS